MSPVPRSVFLGCYATHVAPRGPNKVANFRNFQSKFRFFLEKNNAGRTQRSCKRSLCLAILFGMCSLTCPPAYERGLRERDVSGCIATRMPGEKNPFARQSRLAGWLIFAYFTSHAHASSLGHVIRPSRCNFGVLRDTRGPTWPKQG